MRAFLISTTFVAAFILGSAANAEEKKGVVTFALDDNGE